MEGITACGDAAGGCSIHDEATAFRLLPGLSRKEWLPSCGPVIPLGDEYSLQTGIP